MKKKDLISIIIPVYNVNLYLDRCLNSVINQTYQNIEIILIDDGSTDGSNLKCDDWLLKDNRINVIHTINNGVSSARNFGLDIARGKYITFVDSDDYVEKNFIEVLYNNLVENNCDMSICSYKIVGDNKNDFKERNQKDLIIYNNPLDYHINLKRYNGFLCNKLFKRKIIGNLRLDNYIFYCEDELFVTNYVLKCQRICYSTEPLYNYFQRKNSGSYWNIWNNKKITVLDAQKKQIELLNNYDFKYYKEYYITYFRNLNDIKHRYNKNIISSNELKKMYKSILKNKNYSFFEKMECVIKFRFFVLYNFFRKICHYFR